VRYLKSIGDGVAEIFSHLEFPERLVKMELAVPIDCMRLPRAGRYEIAILFDGRAGRPIH
jgi:hypothetical protein